MRPSNSFGATATCTYLSIAVVLLFLSTLLVSSRLAGEEYRKKHLFPKYHVNLADIKRIEREREQTTPLTLNQGQLSKFTFKNFIKGLDTINKYIKENCYY